MVLQIEQNDKVTDSTLKNLQSLNFDELQDPSVLFNYSFWNKFRNKFYSRLTSEF